MEEQGNGDKISAKFLRLRTPDPESEPPPSNAPRTLGNIPVDYEFNDLLVNIAKQLSRADIEEMKARLKGDKGIKARVREKITNGLELFDFLQKDLKIDRDNLLLLQALLYRMNKHELFDLAVEYAQTKGNVIHFKKPPDEPPNGYTYVQIHIGGVHADGPNVNQYSRSFLEALKSHAARLMFVPPEYVVIAGIEPSSSLLITLMIQTDHVQYIKRAAESKKCIHEWTNFGVDFITIDGKQFFLTDQTTSKRAESETERRLKNIYKLYEEAENKLECRDAEILALKKGATKTDDQALKDAIHSEAEITRLTEKLNDETVKRLRADRLYNEAQKQLKKKEDLILQQKKELFDFKVKNDEEKDFYDFFCNDDSQRLTEKNPKRRPWSSGTSQGMIQSVSRRLRDIKNFEVKRTITFT